MSSDYFCFGGAATLTTQFVPSQIAQNIMVHAIIDKPKDIITSMEDVRRLSGCKGNYSIDKVCSRRIKVGDGLIKDLDLIMLPSERDGSIISSYFLLTGDELYVCGTRGSEKGRPYGKEPCTTFPLTWDQQVPGLDVHFSRNPRKQKSEVSEIKIILKDQSGEVIYFNVRLDCYIYEMMEAYSKRKGIEGASLRLLLDGEELDDIHTFADYELESGDVLDVVLNQCGGMYHYSSGRNGFDKLWKDYPIKQVRIKYGPEDDDELEIELENNDTRETLMTRANIQLKAIKALEEAINSLKRPLKKQKTSEKESSENESDN